MAEKDERDEGEGHETPKVEPVAEDLPKTEPDAGPPPEEPTS